MGWTALGVLLLGVLLLLGWRAWLALRMRRCAPGRDLRRQRVLLTGGTAGFGRRVLLRLLEAQAEAVLFVGRDVEAAAAAVAEAQALAARGLSGARDAASITHFS